MPTVVRKDLDNTHAILTVHVLRDDIKPKIDAELKKFRQKANIKGFRQGQAPMPFIKKLYGTSLFADTINKMFSDELFEYIKTENLDILGQPMPTEDQERFSFNLDKMEDRYSVNYEIGLVPKFEIKGLDASQSFDRLVVSDLEELAKADLQQARKKMGKRTNPTDDIKDNDIVKINGKEKDGEGYEHVFTVLVNAMPDGPLKEEILTKKLGDTLDFNARELDNYKDEKMYRKYILGLDENDEAAIGDLFSGEIAEVSRVSDAELDEEFFNGYFGGQASDEAGAIELLKENIRSFYDVRSNALLMRDFQARLMAENPMELPDAFLKRWLAASNEKLDAATIDKEFPSFADNLRWTLMRDKIKEQFGVFVSSEELRAEYEARVRNYFQMALPPEIIDSSVDRIMQNKEDVEKTTRDLETDKVFQAIRSVVTVTDREVTSEELHETIDAATKAAEIEQGADATLQDALV